MQGVRSRTHEGTGIGLALVQELAKLHGGSIHVTSEIDRGSTFTVRIRCGTAHLPRDQVQAGRRSQPAIVPVPPLRRRSRPVAAIAAARGDAS